MIPYADFEKAIARWKSRQAGGHTHEVGDEHVVGEAYAEEHVVEGSGLITIEETTKP
jgi:hypothetical protein